MYDLTPLEGVLPYKRDGQLVVSLGVQISDFSLSKGVLGKTPAIISAFKVSFRDARKKYRNEILFLAILVFFRGQKKLINKQHPDWSPLGIYFKIPARLPIYFTQESPPVPRL